MAPKPTKASVVPFRPAERPPLPRTVLPIPAGALAPVTSDLPAAIDLTGKRKAMFLIGRGRIGKTTLARWIAETVENRGGSQIIAAADPVNRGLRVFVDGVAEPPSSDPAEVKDWLRDLLQYAMAEKLNALIDLGGGDTSLAALLQDVPDLAEVLEASGIAPVAIHVTGPDPHDLVPLAMTEAAGFRPAATAVVLNEAHGRRSRFDAILQHEAVQSALARGAVQLWMPLLNPDAARQCDAHAWHYHDVKSKAGPFAASAVQTWLRRMGEEFSPITSWLPEE
jgi:hypothetical protein